MATTFTTWDTLAATMRDDMARGSWRVKSYDIDGIRREFVSPSDFLTMLDYVERRAREEAAPYVGRTAVGSAVR